MKTGILFDLDGTLLDTLADLADSVNHVLASFGYPQRTVEEVRQFVGNGAARLIAQAVPEGANPAPVLAAFQPYYSAHCQIKTKPYEGIPDMVYKAMASIGADTCIYVGDSDVDVLTANNAGVPCLSVLWGFRDRACMEAVGAKHFCESPAQLVADIEEIIHGK